MTYKDFKKLKQGKKYSIGKFSDNLYALEEMTGYGCVPAYHKLSKAEFNTYDREKIRDILARPVFCGAYEGQTEFDENKM